jgi:hypothetical protein
MTDALPPLQPKSREDQVGSSSGDGNVEGGLRPATGLSPLLRGARWTFRARVAEHPSLYIPFARLKYAGPGPQVVGPDTELVIDGFTRSATTFAVVAFQSAQERLVRTAHHLHAPAQLIMAARRGLPAMALIREPEGAVLSALVREPYVRPADAYGTYARFYTKLMPYRARLAVAEFGEVSRDFGSVIRRVNEKFGTAFGEFEHTPENVRACFDLIEIRARRPPWEALLGAFESGYIGWGELHGEMIRYRADLRTAVGTRGVTRAARPSADREGLKETLRRSLLRPDLRDVRMRARRAYERFAFE